MKAYTKPEVKVTVCKSEPVLLVSGTSQSFTPDTTKKFSDIKF